MADAAEKEIAVSAEKIAEIVKDVTVMMKNALKFKNKLIIQIYISNFLFILIKFKRN
jgi:hypothetical protein